MCIINNVETDVVFTQSVERFETIIISRIIVILVMILMYKFTKKKGNLNTTQWIVMSILFIISDIANGLIISYTNINSLQADEQYIFLGISSCICLVVLIGFITFAKLSKENDIKLENQILTREKVYQERNIETIRISNEEISHLKHDFKNYLLIIKKYIINNEYDKAIEECNKITGKFDNVETFIDCKPAIISLIINEKVHEAKSKGIDVKCKIISEINLKENTDFIIVFVNLIDNAIEHCLLMDTEKRKILIDICQKMGFVVLRIENSLNFNEELLSFETTKLDKGHGIGHKSVKKIIQNNGGDIKYSLENQKFVVDAFFKKKVNIFQQ